jgi:hypothetical protein
MALQGEFSVQENVPELQGAVVRRTVRDLIGEKIEFLINPGILQVRDLVPSARPCLGTPPQPRNNARRHAKGREQAERQNQGVGSEPSAHSTRPGNANSGFV